MKINNYDDLLNQNEKDDEVESKKDEMNDPFGMDMEMDFSNIFNNNPEVQDLDATTASDGLILSLTNLGCVDIEYISKITNKTMEDVISDLKGSIFQNPLTWDEIFYKGWETKEEYLSGNLRDKYKIYWTI